MTVKSRSLHPPGECLLVVAAVSTLHLFDPVTSNKKGDLDLSGTIHLPSLVMIRPVNFVSQRWHAYICTEPLIAQHASMSNKSVKTKQPLIQIKTRILTGVNKCNRESTNCKIFYWPQNFCIQNRKRHGRLA